MRRRNFHRVVDRMITHIPAGEPLKEALERENDAAGWTAPELRVYNWNNVSALLAERFPNYPSEEWGQIVCEIFIAKNVEEGDYVA